MARSERHRERARVIARLMWTGRWTPSVRAELREQWSKEGCGGREFRSCVEAARIAVEAEVGADLPTREKLLGYVQESLAEVKALADTAMSAYRDPDANRFEKAHFLDSALRAHPSMHAYLQLLLGESKRDDVSGLPALPPDDLMRLLEELYRKRKGGSPE